MLSPRDQERLADACAFAVEHHAAQTRKGTSIPYVSHLMQVAGLVLEYGGDVDQAVAALLHDTLEDCPEVTRDVLRSRFGDDVLAIVVDCSDTVASEERDADEKPPWQERKESYLSHLEAADPRSALVSICDKVHNLGTIVQDLEADGPSSLDRFTAGGERQVWYFGRILEIGGPKVPTKLSRRLESLLDAFRAALPDS